jgi:FlaA1/EpsC-like NDP-sugar epimerase
MFTSFGLCAYRIVYKFLRVLLSDKKYEDDKSSEIKNALVIGRSHELDNLATKLTSLKSNTHNIKGIITDNEFLKGNQINGIKIIGVAKDLRQICHKHDISEILIADKDDTIIDIELLKDMYINRGIKLYRFSNIEDLTSVNNESIKLKQLDITDLLGRKVVKMGIEDKKFIEGKNVLVTGGGGSIGSELCRQISKYHPKKLIILDIYENSAYDIQQELLRTHGNNVDICIEIASIRDKEKMENIFKTLSPDIVFHAAAHKHVPLMEHNPEEAIKNNVFGTYNVAKMADKYDTSKFVLISTDKAVNPTNIMGATKRIAEMIIQYFSTFSCTSYSAVRFGNVLGSNGSVIPLFQKQIESGGPVTVTHPEIVRYFMTISEAVDLVLQAGALADGGEIFILDMGQPVKIRDLAENMIKLSGLKLGKDIKIEYTGIRPGEKLYEELLTDDENIQKTSNNKIYIGQSTHFDLKMFTQHLNELKELAESNNTLEIFKFMQEVVPSYRQEDGSYKSHCENDGYKNTNKIY